MNQQRDACDLQFPMLVIKVELAAVLIAAGGGAWQDSTTAGCTAAYLQLVLIHSRGQDVDHSTLRSAIMSKFTFFFSQTLLLSMGLQSMAAKKTKT